MPENCKNLVNWSRRERSPKSKRRTRFQEKTLDRKIRRSEIRYSVASFSITTFRCAVTSLCNFTGTSNSPTDFNGSWS